MGKVLPFSKEPIKPKLDPDEARTRLIEGIKKLFSEEDMRELKRELDYE